MERVRLLRKLLLLMVLTTAGCALYASAVGFAETLQKPEECLVCRKTHASADHSANYKGRKVNLCSAACLAEYRNLERDGALDPMTGRIEPRAALFQEDSNPRGQLSNAYFIGGFYVLSGLVCGGLASFLAIQKGLGGWPAFALGLAFNVIGLVVVWLRPRRAMPFTSEGLTKIPSTRAELICQACGHANHPSARRCNSCAAELVPQAPSEVELAGLQNDR